MIKWRIGGLRFNEHEETLVIEGNSYEDLRKQYVRYANTRYWGRSWIRVIDDKYSKSHWNIYGRMVSPW